MISAPGYHSYGGTAYQPEGEPYAQIQHVLMGVTPWSVGFQDFFKALLAAFNGQLQTDVKRREIRDEMVKQANSEELKERYKSLSLRTITAWFAKARDDLKMILRARRETSNDWETTFAKPFLARLEKPAPQPAPPPAPPPAPKSDAIAKELPIDLEMAKWAVEFSEKKGWRLVDNGTGKPDRAAIEGVDQQELSDPVKGAIQKHWIAIQAFLTTHQRE
jgi:hypothetical protein